MIYDLANDLSQDSLCAILDVNGKVIFASKSHLKFLGYQSNVLSSYDLHQFIHPKDLPLVQNELATMLKQKKPVEITYRIKHHNGEWVSLCSKCKPFNEVYILVTSTLKENIIRMIS